MGFRYIHAFNLAMLTKQAWHLIQGGHSLFFRVYKAHYFPTCSFMEASLGSNPSYVWRSLLEARELIKAATVWKEDDGKSIKLEDHRWLPHPPKFQPNANMSLRVSDLFDPCTKHWHTHVLHTIFMHSTVEDIQQINLKDTHTTDELLWKENKKGIFSVKTAYPLAVRQKQQEQGEHSSAWDDRKMWNRIWQLHIPPKVQNFVWRACSDILPIRTNLCRRKVPLDPVCGICQKQNETVAHALWSCPMARNVWALVAGKLQKRSSKADIYVLVRELMAVLSTKELEVWAIVSWPIWNARNRCLFDKKQIQPCEILRGAMTLLQDYQRLCQWLPTIEKQRQRKGPV